MHFELLLLGEPAGDKQLADVLALVALIKQINTCMYIFEIIRETSFPPKTTIFKEDDDDDTYRGEIIENIVF